jgi:hypothetical protein
VVPADVVPADPAVPIDGENEDRGENDGGENDGGVVTWVGGFSMGESGCVQAWITSPGKAR